MQILMPKVVFAIGCALLLVAIEGTVATENGPVPAFQSNKDPKLDAAPVPANKEAKIGANLNDAKLVAEENRVVKRVLPGKAVDGVLVGGETQHLSNRVNAPAAGAAPAAAPGIAPSGRRASNLKNKKHRRPRRESRPAPRILWRPDKAQKKR